MIVVTDQGHGSTRFQLRRCALDCPFSQPQQLLGDSTPYAQAACVADSRHLTRVQTNGALITSCDLHDHLISNFWNRIEVQGQTMRHWVTQWLLQGTKSSYMYDAFDAPPPPSLPATLLHASSSSLPSSYDVQWPLNPTCPGPK
jgi:hypothetical protein